MKFVRHHFSSRVSLRLLLTSFFVAQIITIAGLVAYVSFRNGQAAVNAVAAELRNNLSARIEQHLVTFLEIPYQINQNNANLIRAGVLDVNDVQELQSYFLEQLKLHPSITSIYFGNDEGGIAGSGREGAGENFYTYNTPDFKTGTFEKFALNVDSGKASLLAQVPNFDARTRAWYINAIKKKSPVWNEIYVLITGQDMAIAASTPIYDEGQRLIGVTSVDIFLSQMNSFLNGLEESRKGLSFIMERSGLLVATSTDEPLVRELNPDGKLERLDAHQSATPIIRNAADALIAQFGEYENIEGRRTLQFDMNGERQLLQVTSLRDEYGIDWLIVVVLPESAFMSQIQQNNRWAMTIIVLAVIISVVLSLWAAQKIIRPIDALVNSMNALRNKDWDDAVASHSRIHEVNELALSFNQMRETLRATMQRLSDEIHERKQAENLMRQSEDRYRTLVENIPVGVFRTGPNGKIIAANPSFHQMFGLKPDGEIKQITARDLFANSHDSGPFRTDLISKGSLTNVDIQCRKRDGTHFWGSVIVRAVLDSGGEVLYFDGTIQDVTQQKKAAETLHYLATHDNLTSIPNRAFFEERLAQSTSIATGRNTELALLFIDLDDFKTVNDTFGHLKGDQLLQLVAQRISSCVRLSDTVARFGGDEFAVLLEGLSHAENIDPVIEKIRSALAQPFLLDMDEIRMTASIGVSIFPDDGSTFDALIKNADHAMYRSKILGKNHYSFGLPRSRE